MFARDTDAGAKRFLARLGELEKGVPVTVGVHPEEGAQQHVNSKITVGLLALIHEFSKTGGRGTKAGGRRRQRSWLRRSFARKKRELVEQVGQAAIQYLQGADLIRAFTRPGKTLHEQILVSSGEDTAQLHKAMMVRVRGQTVIMGRGGFGKQARRLLGRGLRRVRREVRHVRHLVRGRA